ncbi:MAG: GWxTD domain-containing protein [Candidatus Eiseniibacteriota bacterium]|jgi:GWxTD domain-containing protein
MALLLVATGAGASQPTAPIIGAGDIGFRLDSAQFRAPNGGTDIELYFEIDNDELEFEPVDERHRARLRVTLNFLAAGEPVRDWSEEPELWVDAASVASSAIHTQILQLRLPVESSVDSVHAQIEDLNARKKGLFHLFARTPRRGEVGLRIDPREFPLDEISIADIEFAQAIEAAAPGAIFMKSGLDVEPNAGRVYGAGQARVQAYYEVYDLRSPPPGKETRRYEIGYAVRGSDVADERRWQKRLSSANEAWADTVGFQVEGLDPGTYHLAITVRDREASALAVIEGRFEVFWRTSDWVEWNAVQEGLAHFFLSSVEYEQFVTLGVGARERYLDTFWASVDPDPEIEGNEVRDEFMRRVRYANERFSNSLLPGIQTDRGRVYIKFGEPDDIVREVIPVPGNDLNAALDQLDRELGSGDLGGTRNITGNDDRSFEVWIYTRHGHELFDTGRQMSTGLSMRFVFVDDLGTGQNFRMIRSTEPFDF